MKRIALLTVLCSLFLTSCEKEPSLQKYFVEHTDSKEFISFDLSPNMLKLDGSKLTAEQSKALASFEKMNILAFKRDSLNLADYEVEKAKVNAILKDKKYQELMRFGSGKDGASVNFVGDEKHIDEFVLYANRKENGFAVVRILGKDMNPDGIMAMMSLLQKTDMDMKQLEPLKQLIKM